MRLYRGGLASRHSWSAMTEPAVSIVVPFLNSARYIDEAVASVRVQTLDEWELILVDGGSTDGSERAARQAMGESDRQAKLRQRVDHGRDLRRVEGLR